MSSNPDTKAGFPLGQVVATANAVSQIAASEIAGALRRHASGDWGDLDPQDVRENERALKHGSRILSAYGSGRERFWIITEADRSVTTILLPQDY
jgi:hypothetical protein